MERNVKNRNHISHSARIDRALENQFRKQKSDRGNKLAHLRGTNSNNNAAAPSPITLSECLQYLSSNPMRAMPIELINAINSHMCENIDNFDALQQHDVMRIISLMCEEESVEMLTAISRFLLTLSLGQHKHVQHLLTIIPRFSTVLLKENIPCELAHNLMCAIGNTCLDCSDCHSSMKLLQPSVLLHLLAFAKVASSGSSCSTFLWTLPFFIDVSSPQQIFFEYSTIIAQVIRSSSDFECIEQALWLFHVLLKNSDTRDDVHIDSGVTTMILQLVQTIDMRIAEPLLFILGSLHHDSYDSVINLEVANFLNQCLTINEDNPRLAQVAFSVITKIIIHLPTANHPLADLAIQHIGELLYYGNYSLHVDVVHFIDHLLLSNNETIRNKRHWVCEQIINHLAYIIQELRDAGVVLILLEIIWCELMNHADCSIKEMLLSCELGEALENHALLAQDSKIANLCAKIVDFLFEEKDEEFDVPVANNFVDAPARMGRGNFAIKPAWMS